MLKPLLLALNSITDSLLDCISTRLCYGCRKTNASFTNKFFCNACYKNLKLNYASSKKYLNYDFSELENILGDIDPIIYPKIFFVTKYNDLSKKFIRDFKYRKPHFKQFIAEEIIDYLYENLTLIFTESKPEQGGEEFKGNINLFFTEVPMYAQKQNKRTYNQAALIAQRLNKVFNRFINRSKFLVNYQSAEGFGSFEINKSFYLKNLFIRSKNTKSLFNKNKYERLEIVKKAFKLSQNYKKNLYLRNDSQNVLIVLDDICTTGATFLELFRLIHFSQLNFDEIIFLAYSGRNIN